MADNATVASDSPRLLTREPSPLGPPVDFDLRGVGRQLPRTMPPEGLDQKDRTPARSKNGIPYSAQTVLTKNWDLLTAKYQTGSHRNQQWLVITTVVHDPAYRQDDWITALNFKKEADGSKWDPQPCSALW